MQYQIKGLNPIEINSIVLDLNGTLAVKGKIDDAVKNRIAALKEMGINILLFTGDQRGNAGELCDELGMQLTKASSQEEKEKAFLALDIETTAAIGNARIDIGMFKHAKVSIATLQAEGIHVGILPHVDIIVPSMLDALDLFLDKNSFAATMRV